MIYRYHAKNASPVKWCLNEKVELLCKLAIVDVRTIYRYHAKNASPVKWCLTEKVELLCKLAMSRLSSGV